MPRLIIREIEDCEGCNSCPFHTHNSMDKEFYCSEIGAWEENTEWRKWYYAGCTSTYARVPITYPPYDKEGDKPQLYPGCPLPKVLPEEKDEINCPLPDVDPNPSGT